VCVVQVFTAQNLAVPEFATAVRLAVEGGLDAAAILDVEGQPLAVAGALDDDEARAIAAVVTRRLRSPDLLGRMLDGELMPSSLDAREVRIGIAARCVFIVAVLGQDSAASCRAADELRADVERMVSEARARPGAPPPLRGGSGGSSSGPAELPVIEVGVTVRRNRN
jgi:hypothetical protein